jgi:uncharacterized protein (TIGR02466 family)
MKNAKIDMWFPTPIYICDEIVGKNYNNQIKQQILSIKNKVSSGGNNWLCDTYNTIGKYDLRQSECFTDLLKTVTDHVNNFASKFNTIDTFSCKESWFNIYDQNDYQEYHIHTHSTFSAVYYVTAPLDSGDIVFENPFGVDMMEIQNITEQNNLTYKNCRYQAKERRLIIFKSYLKHMVMRGNNTDERISIAFNYI